MGNSCTGISLSSAGSAHAHTSTSADSHHSAAPASGTTFTATTTSTNTCSSMVSTSTELSSSGFPLVSSTPLRSGSKSLHCFTYNDLKSATGGFRPESFLGEGGFGAVYKGWIDENGYAPTKPGMGMMIAVKKLKSESMQGHREWLAEVHFLGQLHHPNLVRLIGFCAEDDYRLLAYEYLSCGSLENHLFLRRGAPISWTIRVQIALGAARGLAFLYEATVIYRDFKASNILLDSDYKAKLSDFGLAKEGPKGNNTHVSTGVKGTYGYAAPEYVATGHLTTKSDIYSYGVVLLELLTGRRTIDRNLPPGEKNLVDWAPPLIQDRKKMYRLMDPRLNAQYSSKGAHTIASLALNCLCLDAKSRPNMTQIIETLESLSISKETIALDAKNQN